MKSKQAREVMREHQSGFVKLNPRWCAIDRLIEDSEKLQKIEQIIEDHDNDRMPEDYFYIDKIREVIEDDSN